MLLFVAGRATAVHAMRHDSLLLPGLLLSEAVALRAVRVFADVLRLLLPQTVALPRLLLF